MKEKSTLILSLAFMLFSLSTLAQNEIFNKIDSPTSSLSFQINQNKLSEQLASAPIRDLSLNRSLTMEFPNFNGMLEKFNIVEAPVMHPDLQMQYPEIRSYAGYGIDEPTAYLRFSYSPYNGLNGIILGSEQATIFKSSSDNPNKVIVNKYSSGKLHRDFICETIDENMTEIVNSTEATDRDADDSILRKYRLAMSVSGEYSVYHGGTLASVNAAINATITTVNGVFENDFNVTLELIATNDQVVYLNPTTDPYSGFSDNNYNSVLQSTLNSAIGAANYDIGHLMAGIGNNGNAGCIGCVCNDSSKGSGYTTSTVPEGPNFDIDYVAHEMGHQFGANHTFTFSQEGGIAQMEPGSGSTIMGYAGITGPNTDLQPNSDPYFHAVSIQQVTNYIKVFGTCSVNTNTGNATPVVNAGNNLTLPIGTAFKLIGTASDLDGDALTYCWEQFDENNAASTYPNPNSTDSNSVLFRSYNPSLSPERIFPKMEDLLENGVNGNTWEKVPNVSRTADFRLTVRDNVEGGANNNHDDVTVTFNSVYGPLEITSQNSSDIIWASNTSETITWNVNNTNALAGSSNVNILLSTDGGLTFSTALATNTPNDGSETITVPDIPAPYCRILIEPTNNQFFAVNTTSFSIDYTIDTTCEQYASASNLDLAIPDGLSPNQQGPILTNVINVPTALNNFTSMKVNVDITHTWVGDLVIQLNHPDTETFNILWGRNCDNGSNSGLDVIFEDGATSIVCANPVSGTYSPATPLSVFNSLETMGDWTIAIADFWNGDTGTLNDWYIEFCTTTETPLAIEDIENQTNLTIYPNPNNGVFAIKLDTASYETIDVQVLDVRGRVIFNENYANSSSFHQTINLKHIQSGMYIVKVSDGHRNFTKRIIVN